MKKDSIEYKPPYFALRYVQEVASTTTEIQDISAKNFIEERLSAISQNGIEGLLDKGVMNSVKVTASDKNITAPNLTNMKNWSIQDAKNYLKTPYSGWARIRCGNLNPQAPSVLPSGDNRYHILLRKPVLRAADAITTTETNNAGVDWVKSTTCQYPSYDNPNPCNINDNVTDYKDTRVEKYQKGKFPTTYTETGQTLHQDVGDDTYRVVILKDSIASIFNDPDPTKRFVFVQYWPELKVVPEENVITPVVVPSGGNVVINSKNTILKKDEISTVEYELDMYSVAHYKQGGKVFGFGIERLDSFMDSRKTVQQTRGNYTEDGSEDNFYVDTWGKGPESITIVGAIELPFASHKDILVSTKKENSIVQQWKNFVETIETFFSWNNNPVRISRGDRLQFIDYYKEVDSKSKDSGQVYDVTFKSRRFTQSVEKQSVIMFEFTFVILGRSK